MKKFGLIGYPLGHSFSQKYFSDKFRNEEIEDAVYELFPLADIDDIRLLFEIEREIHGLNVTIPYKESIIEYLDDIDETAKEIGAVNCIKVIGPDSMREKKGFNTDWMGFSTSLKPLLKPHHKNALILGTGGSSKAVAYSLKKLNIDFKFVSRNNSAGNLMYSDLTKEIIEQHTVIINCTPIGMFPNIEASPSLPYEFLSAGHLCFDLIYNPEETTFLKRSKAQGARVKNGLEMLHLQAEFAWKIWNEEDAETGDQFLLS